MKEEENEEREQEETTTMVSDLEIAQGIESLLRQQPPTPHVTSLNGVVQHLGAKLGVDLSHKAGFIRDHINNLIIHHNNHHHHHNQNQLPRQIPPPPPRAHQFPFVNYQQQSQQQQQQQQQHDSRLQFQFQFQQQQQQNYSPHLGRLQFPGFGGGGGGGVQFQQFQQQQQLYQVAAATAAAGAQVQSPTTQFAAAAQQPVRNVSPVVVEKTAKESASSGTKRKGGTGGLSKVCGLSPELQAVVGQSALARTEVVKQLWVYIRKHNLQDPSNKRKIICDEALRLVFETDCTDMFKMNKLLSKHIFPLQPTNEPSTVKRSKADVQDDSQVTESVSTVVISEELANFLGTTKREIDLAEATNCVWNYIKANGLEDSDKMVINCDEKLGELFQSESVPVSALNETIARHFVQSS